MDLNEDSRAWANVALWVQFILCSSVLLIAGILRLGNFVGFTHTSDESIDFRVWFIALAVTGALAICCFNRTLSEKFSARNPGLFVLGTLILFSIGAISAVEPFMDIKVLWFGFGTQVALLTLLILPIIYLLITNRFPVAVRYLAIISVPLALVFYLPLAIQPLWGIMDPFTSGYVLNEVLAPSLGHMPLVEQATQYTSLYGLPLAAVNSIFGSILFGIRLAALAAMWISALTLLALLLLVFIAFRTLPWRLRKLAILFTLPLILVKVQPADVLLGSLTALWSAIPIRTLTTLAALALMLLALPHSGRKRVALFAVVGVVTGVGAMNNLEFGVPALIAISTVSFFVNVKQLRSFASYLVALAVGFFSYALLLTLSGQRIRFEEWFAFVLAFGSGFGGVPMPLFGTYVLILGLLCTGTVTGLYGLLRLNKSTSDKASEQHLRLQGAAAVALALGASGLGSFGYYVGRSVSSGQLQTFLIFVAGIIPALLGLIVYSIDEQVEDKRRMLRVVALLIPASLCLAAIVQAPDARFEWQRVAGVNSGAMNTNPFAEVARRVTNHAQTLSITPEFQGLVAAVDFGNYVESVTGYTNYSALDRPSDAVNSDRLTNLYCQRLAQANGPILVQEVVSGDPNPYCSGFRLLSDLGDEFSVIVREGER